MLYYYRQLVASYPGPWLKATGCCDRAIKVKVRIVATYVVHWRFHHNIVRAEMNNYTVYNKDAINFVCNFLRPLLVPRVYTLSIERP